MLRNRCVKEMLKRSQKSPLIVYAGTSKRPQRILVPSLKVILKQMSRIESIQFKISPNIYDQISAFADLPMPQLKCLVSSSVSEMEFMPKFPFGFDHPLPLLEHLDLTGYLRTAIQPMWRPTLKRLILSRPRPPFTLEVFVDALKYLPSLTDLSLDRAFMQRHHSTLSKDDPFHSILYIPSLQSLTIQDRTSGSPSASFLNAISFPPTTATRYSFEITNERDVSLLHAVEDKLNLRSSSTPLQSLVLQYYNVFGGGILGIGALPTIVENPPKYNTLDEYPFSFHLRSDFPRRLAMSMKQVFIVHAFKRFPFHDIRILNISGDDLDTAIWALLVRGMPNVERLFIQEHARPNLLAVMPLGKISEATGDTIGNITAFPKLRTLDIHFYHHIVKWESRPSLIERLVCDLESRRAGGLGLESLRIQNGKGTSEEIVNRLRAVVHHLEWNANE